jgi:hypothetical protein
MPIIPALRRLRQEDGEFKASLGYIVSSRAAWATVKPCLKIKHNLSIKIQSF